MAAIQNELDKYLQAAPIRLEPVALPPNFVLDPSQIGPGSLPSNVTTPDGSGFVSLGNVGALQIVANGLTIKTPSGQMVLDASRRLNRSDLTDLGVLAGLNALALGSSQLTGFGTLAGKSSVATGDITGLGALATQNTVNLSNQVTGALANGNVSGLGALALLNVVNLNTQTTGAINGATQVTNLGTLAYANALAANQIAAGTFAAGVAYIGDINVSQLRAGNIGVSDYIRSQNFASGVSGWQINGTGTSEFSNGIFRGGLYASYGLIGGIQINNGNMQSTNYNAVARTGFLFNANGTIDLPGGSINADHLNIGLSGNLLANSTWVERQTNSQIPVGWSYGNDGSAGNPKTVYGGAAFPDYFPASALKNGIAFQHTNAAAGTSQYMLVISDPVPVVPNQRYEFSVYSGSLNCLIVTDISWYARDGSQIGASVADGTIQNAAAAVGGKSLGDFKRIGCFGVAPNNASTCRVRVIKFGRNNTSESTDTYAFLLYPYFGAAGASQNKFTLWSQSGLSTRISPDGIVTPSLQAISGVMGDLYSGSVRGGSFTGPDWPAGGAGGFYLGPNGLMLGNFYAGQYIHIAPSGTFQIPGMSCFGGKLSIHQIDVIDTLNIAGNAVTVPIGRSAAGGGVGASIQIPDIAGAGSIPVVVLAVWNNVRLPGALNVIYRNSAEIKRAQSNSSGGVVPYLPVAMMAVDYPGPGVHTYETGCSVETSDVTIFVMGAKR